VVKFMRKITILIIAAAIVCLSAGLVPNPAFAAEEYEYIDISNPFLRKIPTAIPGFKNVSGNAKGRDLSIELADSVSKTLEFTGYFEMLDHGAFLADPNDPKIVAQEINFRNWTVIGSELLVTGSVALEEAYMELELRMFDTFQEKLIVGKRYRGRIKNQLQMIHRFCAEVMYHLTGNRGVFNSQIAFVSKRNSQKEIFISAFDGYNPRQFTSHNDITLFPAWSSDAQFMAYTSYKGGKPDLYIRNIP